MTTGGPTVPYKDTDIQKKRDIANDPGIEFYSEDERQALKHAENVRAVNVTTERGTGLSGTLAPGENEETDVERHTWRYSAYFSNPANDGWMARQAINDLMHHPVIPEPPVTVEVLKSCRRMNDYALAVRYLESIQTMMYGQKDKIWPWYHQEIEPTLKELGVLTPEEMGYDKPELFLYEPEDY